MERAKVGCVIISVGVEYREYADCWVVVDHAEHLLYIWLDPEQEQPDVTAPLQTCLIEWGRMSARPRDG